MKENAKTVGLLMNEKALRRAVAADLDREGVRCTEFATATQAVPVLTSRTFDLVALDAATFPGFGCLDGEIRDLAAMIPRAELNEAVLYWQVTLRMLDIIHEDGGPNVATPVIIRVPEARSSSIGMGDVLARESVEKDLRSRSHVRSIFDADAQGLVREILFSL